MEVLYEYTAGSAPQLAWAIVFWAIGALLVIFCIVRMIMDGEVSLEGLLCLTISVVIGVLGFGFNSDTHHQEIKATVNDTISWKEVNEKYELIKQEGEIYTFRVKEDAGEN